MICFECPGSTLLASELNRRRIGIEITDGQPAELSVPSTVIVFRAHVKLASEKKSKRLSPMSERSAA
jgi:hypothetical protein